MSSTVKKCETHPRRGAKWRHPKEDVFPAEFYCQECHKDSGCERDKPYPSLSTKAKAKANKRKGTN